MRLFSLPKTGLTCLRPGFRPPGGTFCRAASTSFRPPSLDFQAIDAKWQRIWDEKKLGRFSSKEDGKDGHPTYVLPMFPYPSGSLHMGHIRVYTISDVVARFNYMQGTNVIHPIGWDAFGLPAENAAIERGVDPVAWTDQNITQMKEQLRGMNGVWDWDREIRTCDPSYYKHTQRIFLMMYEAGLAYQKEASVNWDPVDCTVLANEQVDANGFSWRSGAKVEQRKLKQWFLAITRFTEDLHSHLETLEQNNDWPSRVVDMQRNWLGKSEGTELSFTLSVTADSENGRAVISHFPELHVFTTRLDTLFGAQFVALSLNHPLVQEYSKNNNDLQTFIESAPQLPVDSKHGFLLPDIAAINPLHKAQSVHAPLPIYAAPYVLEDYGTGAVMGVPAHDARDHAFWKQHRGSEPVKSVISQSAESVKSDDDVPFSDKGKLNADCGDFAGLHSDEASQQLASSLQQDGTTVKRYSLWRIRDWLISRQRYWGAPIPIIHCQSCGTVPVPTKDLPVELPKLPPGQFKGRSGNPLEQIEEWVNTSCPSCKGPARRDTDTMDTFMDSSWYFFRFADSKNELAPVDSDLAKRIMPVDFYVGGVEHAILHLLYARFIAKFLASSGGGSVWPLQQDTDGKRNVAEPFKKLVTQGMVHGRTYSDPSTGRFLKPDEVETSQTEPPKIRATGETPNVSFEKMSKSKYNGVDPGSCIGKYGADVTRAHMLFAAPESEVLEWEEQRIGGISRWLAKVWRVVHLANSAAPPGILRDAWTRPTDESGNVYTSVEAALLRATRNTTATVTSKLQSASAFNTVVSDLIKLTNALASAAVCSSSSPKLQNEVSPSIYLFCVEVLIRLMAPLTPAFAEESWQTLHEDGKLHFDCGHTDMSANLSIFESQWPKTIKLPTEIDNPTQTCVLQVNGKRKFDCKVEIHSREQTGEPFKEWFLAAVFKRTPEGLKWISDANNRILLETSERVVVGNNGRIVNIVNKGLPRSS